MFDVLLRSAIFICLGFSIVVNSHAVSIVENDTTTLDNDNENQNIAFFIHGILGDGLKSWGDLPMLLQGEDQLRGWDFAFWNYPSSICEKTTISQLGDLLNTELRNLQGLNDYRQVILIAHSMGGLVARSYIVSQVLAQRAADLKKVKGLVTFATPHLGSPKAQMAKLLAFICDNQQVSDIDAYSDVLSHINREWDLRVIRSNEDGGWQGTVIAVAGTKDTIVPYPSAIAAFANIESLPYGHRDIIKPSSRGHKMYGTLLRILKNTKLTDQWVRQTVTLKKIDFFAGDKKSQTCPPSGYNLGMPTEGYGRCGQVCVSIPKDAKTLDVRSNADHGDNLGGSWFAWLNDGEYTNESSGDKQRICKAAMNWSDYYDRPITIEVKFER